MKRILLRPGKTTLDRFEQEEYYGSYGAGSPKEFRHAAKTASSLPVILTGGVTAAQETEALLREGAAELIGVGRALLRGPDGSVKALRA